VPLAGARDAPDRRVAKGDGGRQCLFVKRSGTMFKFLGDAPLAIAAWLRYFLTSTARRCWLVRMSTLGLNFIRDPPPWGDWLPGLTSKTDNFVSAAFASLLDLLGIGICHPMDPCVDFRFWIIAPSGGLGERRRSWGRENLSELIRNPAGQVRMGSA
jgi:hypothetical protein